MLLWSQVLPIILHCAEGCEDVIEQGFFFFFFYYYCSRNYVF